jgi:hypothetical protein
MVFYLLIVAKYFGGQLDFRNVSGYGADIFVEFPNISLIKDKYQI